MFPFSVPLNLHKTCATLWAVCRHSSETCRLITGTKKNFKFSKENPFACIKAVFLHDRASMVYAWLLFFLSLKNAIATSNTTFAPSSKCRYIARRWLFVREPSGFQAKMRGPRPPTPQMFEKVEFRSSSSSFPVMDSARLRQTGPEMKGHRTKPRRRGQNEPK